MKLFSALVFLLALFSVDASAQRGPGRHTPQGYYTCQATDNGWEEHFGGHNDCGSCLRKHGTCVETCSEQIDVCTAKGTSFEGRTATVTMSGRSRRDAEYSALSACQRSRHNRNCVIKSCGTRSNVVSRRSCR